MLLLAVSTWAKPLSCMAGSSRCPQPLPRMLCRMLSGASRPTLLSQVLLRACTHACRQVTANWFSLKLFKHNAS